MMLNITARSSSSLTSCEASVESESVSKSVNSVDKPRDDLEHRQSQFSTQISSVNNSFLPILSTPAGSCLTLENWRQIGIDNGVYSLEALLVRPGSDVLKDLGTLRSYSAWSGTLILNACLRPANAAGDYIIRSPYDGRIIKTTKTELLILIHQLKPDYVIWPDENWDDESVERCEDSLFLVPGDNYLEDGSTLFYQIDDGSNEFSPFFFRSGHGENAFSEEISGCSTEVLGSGSHQWCGGAKVDEKPLTTIGSPRRFVWFESDKPAADGLQGMIYSSGGIFNLLEPRYRDEFSPLDKTCGCPTCKDGYTRAYLHHLLQQTPLLAQRFLILHNISFFRTHLFID